MTWIGRLTAAPLATQITAPSPMNAVLSATAMSSVGTSVPRRDVTDRSPSASALPMDLIVRPASRPARSESFATNEPSTKTRRRAPVPAKIAPAPTARPIAAVSGAPASPFASRISARRSVYFHSSTRRCGSPCSSKRRNAAARRSAIAAAPGSSAFAAAKTSASRSSATVFIARTSTFMSCLDRLGLELGISACFEIERELLAPGLHDPALGEDVHHVGHDVIEKALVVGDDDHGALGRAEAVDAVGDGPQRIDVEPRIGLIEHREPRLDHRHLQDLVALLLAAREPDVDGAAQHVLVDAECGGDLTHLAHERGCG